MTSLGEPSQSAQCAERWQDMDKAWGQQAAMRATFPSDAVSHRQGGGEGLLTDSGGILDPRKRKSARKCPENMLT